MALRQVSVLPSGKWGWAPAPNSWGSVCEASPAALAGRGAEDPGREHPRRRTPNLAGRGGERGEPGPLGPASRLHALPGRPGRPTPPRPHTHRVSAWVRPGRRAARSAQTPRATPPTAPGPGDANGGARCPSGSPHLPAPGPGSPLPHSPAAAAAPAGVPAAVTAATAATASAARVAAPAAGGIRRCGRGGGAAAGAPRWPPEPQARAPSPEAGRGGGPTPRPPSGAAGHRPARFSPEAPRTTPAGSPGPLRTLAGNQPFPKIPKYIFSTLRTCVDAPGAAPPPEGNTF